MRLAGLFSRFEEWELSALTALSVLLGIGISLTGFYLVDFYLEWILQGEPLWVVLGENGIPLLLASSILYLTGRLIGKTQKQLYLSEAAKWCALGFTVMLTVSSVNLAIQMVRGTMVPMVIQALALGSAAGCLLGYYTARLKQSRSELRSITENVQDGIYRSTPGEGLVYVNQAFVDMFGYDDEEEILQADPAELYADPEVRTALIQQEEDRGQLDGVEVTHKRKDGSVFTGCLRSRPVFDEDGDAVYYDGLVTDITERTKRERQLRLLSEAVQQSTEAILITEALPDSEPDPIVYVNSAFEEMTGYSEEDLLGESPELLRGPATEDDVLDSLRASMQAGEPWSGETINYRKDGRPFVVAWETAPVRNPDDEIAYWVSVQRDVTEERERKETLRRQRSLLEQTQRLAGGWEVDVQTGELSWTEEVYRIHDVPPGTDIGVAEGISFYAPRARSTIREALNRCIEEREPYDLELPLVTDKGKRRWIRTVGAPVEEENGQVVKVAGAIQDITEQREAERALQEERNRLETLFQNLPTPVVRCTVEDAGIFIDEANEAFEHVFGVEDTTTEGVDIDELIVPKDERKEAANLARRAVEKDTQQAEVRRKAVGGQRDFRLQIAGRKPDHGPSEVYVIYTDITERKRRERKLKDAKEKAEEAKELFETIFNNVPVLIEIVGQDGGFRRYNAHLEEVVGWSTKEIRDHPNPRETLYPDPDERERARRVMQEAPDGWHEFRLTTKRGDAVDTIWTFAPLSDGRRIGIGLDMTEQRQRERELRNAKEEAEEANQMKSAFLANMSHEIRTPLTSIVGFAEVLKDDLNGEMVEIAEKVYRSSNRLMKTLTAVLQLSKLEAGEAQLEREPVQLGEVAEETVELLRPAAEEEQVNVDTTLPEEAVVGHWNVGAVNRITENLLSNAIKFTPEGGRVEVEVWKEGGNGIISVEDTGVGISEEALPYIFEAFRQESEGIGREFEGSGLGLSIVKRLTRLLGGDIAVESEEGKGTRFVVQLPLSSVQSDGMRGSSASPKSESIHGSSPRSAVGDPSVHFSN